MARPGVQRQRGSAHCCVQAVRTRMLNGKRRYTERAHVLRSGQRQRIFSTLGRVVCIHAMRCWNRGHQSDRQGGFPRLVGRLLADYCWRLSSEASDAGPTRWGTLRVFRGLLHRLEYFHDGSSVLAAATMIFAYTPVCLHCYLFGGRFWGENTDFRALHPLNSVHNWLSLPLLHRCVLERLCIACDR